MKTAIQKPGWPLISVITVTYNSAGLLEETLKSIRSQTYPYIEYIIIDGASTDNTPEVIHRYEDVVTRWVCEPDEGIYYAMNKGLELFSGDYVWFINSGDRIYRPDTVEKMVHSFFPEPGPSAKENRSDGWPFILYGDTMIINRKGHEIGLRRLRPPEVLTSKSFQKGMLVCHQSVLVSRKLVEPYNLHYHHSADFDWVIRMLKKAENLTTASIYPPIFNTRMILSGFLDGGHSKQHIPQSLKERFHSMRTHYGWTATIFRHLWIPFRFVGFVIKNRRF
ncbi:MAG: glycosyltransferase [Bacteroidales bacterium]|nr:glycosyltransferase [Bacteroidales bacterium]